MCTSRIITEAESLPPGHPGKFLREEFGIGSTLNLADVVAERADMDGATDLRLARYFKVSEGLFLGLQHQFALDSARRDAGSALDAIMPFQTAAE